MRVSLVQTLSAPEGGDNLAAIMSAVKEAKGDVLIFPELFLTGYTTDAEIHERVSEGHERWRARLKTISHDSGKWLMVGAPYPTEKGLMNVIWIFSPEGEEKVYEKLHLADFGVFSEADAFVPGDAGCMVDIGGFRFGLSICYDMFFPELYRRYALMGADVLVCASASPMKSKGPFDKVLPARAVENTCYMLFVNHVGEQGRFEFFGGSRAISPIGYEMSNCEDATHCIIEVELSREELERAREGRPTLRDHRGDLDWGSAV